jgi:hypothetical protein
MKSPQRPCIAVGTQEPRKLQLAILETVGRHLTEYIESAQRTNKPWLVDMYIREKQEINKRISELRRGL